MSDKRSIARLAWLAATYALVALGLVLGLGLSAAPSASRQLALDPADGFPAYAYFQATRPDLRLCPSPLCGGVFVERVNRRGLRCPDGTRATECLANAIDWSLLGLDPAAETKLAAEFGQKRVLVRGRLALDDSAIGFQPAPAVLLVREAWRGVTGTIARRNFQGVVPSDIVCITFPCPSFLKTRLNWRMRPKYLHGVNLSESGASADETSRGFAAIHNGGLIVSGHRRRIHGPAGRGHELVAKEFYAPVRTEPRACGGFTFPPNPSCERNEFCDPPPDTCFVADIPGTCKEVSQGCPELYDPVCGCDGRTYSSECHRLMAGVALSHPGECESIGPAAP